jgi:hypothetical protein
VSQNKVELVFGRKGTGKSYSIKRGLDKMRPHAPLVVFDFNREYHPDAPNPKDPIRGARLFRSLDEFLAAQRAQKGHIGRAVIWGSTEDFVRMCTFVYASGGMTFVLDELHVYVEPTQYPPIFKKLMYVGRHRRIDIIAAAWRPYGLPPFLRHAADEIRAFQTCEPRDLEWFRANCGVDLANALPRLPLRKSITWVPGVRGSVLAPRESKSSRKRST